MSEGAPIRRLLMALTMALSSMWSGPLSAQDFNKGLQAYLRGDFATVLQEWRPLAEKGDASAQFSLGVLYYNGRGVPQDYAEAVNWYRLAAEQGYADAQSNLGVMYANGRGFIQDFVKAHMWVNIAASLGTENAASIRDALAAKMTPEQIADAQRLARECVAANYKGC
jgi:TPR repeat protein